MANVNHINETAQPVTGPAKNKPRTAEGSSAFDTVLSNALEKSDGSDGTAGVTELQELAAPRLEPRSPSDSVSGKTDALLGLMDTYAAQLGDHRVSLKSIAPVLEKMNEEARELMKETRFLPSDQGALKEIATRTAVTAQTEYVRFQRGDYLS